MALERVGVKLIVVGLAGFSRAMRTAQDDLQRVNKSIENASKRSLKLGSSINSLGNNMQRLGRTLLIDVTAPLGILTASLISSGAQFEDTFAGVTKTVEGLAVGFDEIQAAAKRDLGITITTMEEARAVSEQLGMSFGDLTDTGNQVRNEFRKMALEVPMASSELNALGEVVGQLGVESDQIADVTELVAKLGVATDVSAETAAFGLIRLANIMGTTVGENAISMEEFVRRAGSAVVDLGNKAVATEGEILNFALRIAAAGSLANMSEQEVLAWSTTLADLGARAESGGTAVSRALNEMSISIATGGENLQTFADVMEMTSDEFVQAFEEDASGALASFVEALRSGLAGEGATITKDMLTDMGLGGIRAADIMLRLGDATTLFSKNLENSNTAWEEAIALEEEAEKRFSTFKSQMQLLKNTFVDLGVSIFDLVEGDLKVLVGYVKNAINWFKGLDEGLKRNIVIVAALAAVVGPLLIGFGALIAFIGTVVTAIGALGAAAIPVIATLAALAGFAGLAIGVGISGDTEPQAQDDVGGAAPTPKVPPMQEQVLKLWQNFLKIIKEDIPAAIDRVKTALQPLIDFLAQMVEEDMAEAWENLKIAWDNLSVAAEPIMNLLRELAPLILSTIVIAITVFIIVISKLIVAFSVFSTHLGTVVKGIADFVTGMVQTLKGLATMIWGIIQLIIAPFKFLYDWITLGWDEASKNLTSSIKQAFDDIAIGAQEWVDGMILQVYGLATSILALLIGLGEGVASIAKGIYDDVIKPFEDLYNDLIGNSILVDLMEDTIGIFTNIKDSVMGIVGELIQGIISAAGSISKVFSGAFSGIFGGGGGAAPAAEGAEGAGGEEASTAGMFNVQQITQLQEAILELESIWESFGTTVSITMTGISNTFTTLVVAVKGVFSNLGTVFVQSFIIPAQEGLVTFSIMFNTMMTMVNEQFRIIALGLFKSWLDFTTNATVQTVQFVSDTINEFGRMKDGTSGVLTEIGNEFSKTFDTGGAAWSALESLGNKVDTLAPRFGALKSAVGSFVSAMVAELLAICDAAADVKDCLEGSPKLEIQHLFETFEDYLRGTDYGNLLEKSMSMPTLENISIPSPVGSGETINNIDQSITANIEGLPMDTAENVVDILLRQIRMAEALQ